MIKNVIGAVIGTKLAERSPNVSNAGGAAGGALAASVIPFVISRLSIPMMVALGAGAWLLSRRKTGGTEADAPETGRIASSRPDTPAYPVPVGTVVDSTND